MSRRTRRQHKLDIAYTDRLWQVTQGTLRSVVTPVCYESFLSELRDMRAKGARQIPATMMPGTNDTKWLVFLDSVKFPDSILNEDALLALPDLRFSSVARETWHILHRPRPEPAKRSRLMKFLEARWSRRQADRAKR
jgi:hypothetical protein